MFDKDFYPTKDSTLDEMLQDIKIQGKIFLEPESGKGNIVDYLLRKGAQEVIACELHPDLYTISASKCKMIGRDFLKITAEQISHIDAIVMNPPFSQDDKHILHAWDIAPAGCQIVSLCNAQTLKNAYSNSRRRLQNVIEQNGYMDYAEGYFRDAERLSHVEVGIIRITKPGASSDTEFEGFFIGEEETEQQANALVSYNFIRDLVNRYVASIKLYDQQLELAVQMNSLTAGFYSSQLAMSVTEEGKPKSRIDFKKDLQKSGWKFIFDKMNMQKYTTKGLMDDINKFVEKQQEVPFTMRNIYKMLEIVIGTQQVRMDKALEEVFDKLTMHTHENRYNVEGWKTNSHYMLNQKFIIDWMVSPSYNKRIELKYNSNAEFIEDMMKALCFLTGDDYNNYPTLNHMLRYRYFLKKSNDSYQMKDHRDMIAVYDTIEQAMGAKKELWEKGINVEVVDEGYPSWGQWFNWGFFQCKAYKKGTVHFKFKDQKLWEIFNKRIAKIKGFVLFETMPRKAAA